jgi:hypothetical protein
MLTLGPGGVLHRHRKVMPTMQERVFHGFGAADDTDGWLASMRHIAIESGAYVVSVPQYIPAAAFPSDFPVPLPEGKEVFGEGGAAIVDPRWGDVIAGPLRGGEGIVIADCDLRAGLHAKRWVGHYSRAKVLAPGAAAGVPTAPTRPTASGPSVEGNVRAVYPTERSSRHRVVVSPSITWRIARAMATAPRPRSTPFDAPSANAPSHDRV